MKKQRPEIFFSVLILILGIVLLLITPAGANFDEETYMARIWEMGLGYIAPNSYLGNEGGIPSSFYYQSYRRQVNLPAIDLDTFRQQLEVKIDINDSIGYQTRASYFPTLFAIQAIIMRLFGAHFHFPLLVVYFLLRFSYLFIYCVLVYLTIKVLPFGKWGIGTLLIAPMCLIQAAAVSADSIIFGVSFLFTAWVLKIASNTKEILTKKEILATCLLILSLGTLKPNAIFLLPLLIAIPAKRYKNYKTWLPIVLASLVSVTISLGWSVLGPQYYISIENSGINPMMQLKTIFLNPQLFIANLWNTLSGSFLAYTKQSIGVAGYGYWNMPEIIYWIFPASLILALFSEPANVNITTRQRVLFGLTGLFNLIMVFVVFFIVVTPVGSMRIEGIQGRYFTQFFPLLLIPFMFTPKIHLNKAYIATLVTLSSLICTASLFLSYHVVCGYAAATNQPCILPYYKNWDPSTFLGIQLDDDTNIKQSEVITCKELTGIQVWINKNNSTSGQKEFFSLGTISGETLRTNWIQSDTLPQTGWTTIAIDPPLNALNYELQFEITPNDGTGIPGLELGRFPTSEFGRGSLSINGNETENDLVFRYTCADNISTILK